MDQSEGRKFRHAMDDRGSAAWQCFGSDDRADPLTRNWSSSNGTCCAFAGGVSLTTMPSCNLLQPDCARILCENPQIS